MASVLSLNEGWSQEDQPKFKVEGQFKPLRDSVNNGDTSVFLWEWFTTKPYVDSGEVRFIGSVYTPWPCWSIAASPNANNKEVSAFLEALQPYVRKFDSEESRAGPAVEFVSKTFGQQPEDVKEWLKSVKWEHNLDEVSEGVLKTTLETLEKAGVVKDAKYDIKDFVNTDVAKVVA